MREITQIPTKKINVLIINELENTSKIIDKTFGSLNYYSYIRCVGKRGMNLLTTKLKTIKTKTK